MAETYLVGHIEEKTEHDVISPTSPLGAALMGKRAGDEVGRARWGAGAHSEGHILTPLTI